MPQSTSDTDDMQTLTDTLATSGMEEQGDNNSSKDDSEDTEDYDTEDTIDNIV